MTSSSDTIYARYTGKHNQYFKKGKVYKLQITTHLYSFFDRVASIFTGEKLNEVYAFRVYPCGNLLGRTPYKKVSDFMQSWRPEKNSYFAKLVKN